jgi:hypothetical protein
MGALAVAAALTRPTSECAMGSISPPTLSTCTFSSPCAATATVGTAPLSNDRCNMQRANVHRPAPSHLSAAQRAHPHAEPSTPIGRTEGLFVRLFGAPARLRATVRGPRGAAWRTARATCSAAQRCTVAAQVRNGANATHSVAAQRHALQRSARVRTLQRAPLGTESSALYVASATGQQGCTGQRSAAPSLKGLAAHAHRYSPPVALFPLPTRIGADDPARRLSLHRAARRTTQRAAKPSGAAHAA